MHRSLTSEVVELVVLCAPVRRVVFKQRVQRARDRADRAVADGVARERRDGDDVRVAREDTDEEKSESMVEEEESGDRTSRLSKTNHNDARG